MRPLHRPMFRYGGPIKEGVMSGIREPHAGGGRAALVGNPVFPKTNGRAHHQINYRFNPKPVVDVAKTTTSQAVKNPGYFARLGAALANFYSPFKKAKPIQKIFKKYRSKLDMPKDRIPSNTGMGGVQLTEGQIAAGMGTQKAGLFNKALQFARLNPKTTIGGAYVASPAVVGGLTSIPYKKAGMQILDLAVPDFIFDQDQYFADKAAREKLEKKETDTTIVEDPPVIIPQKSADEIRAERIQKYRDIMDIKGMNKRAAYDSLIDASKLVSESGDFKGDIKSGKLINDIIQATSRQFDKPAKTKDAIDTLILKGEIEADIAAGKPSTYLKTAQDMVATGAAKNITEAMKLLTKSSNNMATTLGAIVAKDGRIDEEKVGIAYRGETGNIPKGMIKVSEVNEWIEDNPGKDELDYTKELLTKTELAPGDYVIGKRVVTIDENKGVSFYY
jgi:hypothetical protein